MQLLSNAHEPTEHAAPFWNCIARVWIDKPADESPHPRIRIRVARGPHIARNARHGAAAAQLIPELRFTDLADFIEGDKRILRSLIVEAVALMFQASEFDARSRFETPLQAL